MSNEHSRANQPPPGHIPPAMIQAAIWRGRFQASMACQALRMMGLSFSQENPLRVPFEYMLDLGAVIQIGTWERLGLSFHIEAGLPSFSEAKTQLAINTNRADYVPVDGLCDAVVRVAMSELSWNAPALLGTEFLIESGTDDDEFVEVMADFLWRNRQTETRSQGEPNDR